MITVVGNRLSPVQLVLEATTRGERNRPLLQPITNQGFGPA
ncbi:MULTISPECIES: hypothetical protein [unclassified Schlesneria]